LKSTVGQVRGRQHTRERQYTIGEVAELTGVAPSALRYYEELGLLPPPLRVSGQRRYGEDALGLVGMILLLRDTGFSLSEIKSLTPPGRRASDAWRASARAKVAELDERIARATAARDALQHALRCRHAHLADCPTFAGVVAAKLAGRTLAEAHTH
jgi:DNA-binding transcriptional MerR regulator